MRSGRVKARQFNRKFTLQKPKTATTAGVIVDELGHIDLSDDRNWTDIGDYWLKLYSQASREFFRAQQTQSDVSHVADVQYSKVTADLKTSYRWFDGTRRLQISAAFDPDDAHEVIQMRLVEAT